MRKKATPHHRCVLNRPGTARAIDKLGIVSLWTMDDTCRYLKVTPGVLRGLVYRRKIPHLKCGRRIRFRQTDVNAWLETHIRPAQ